MVSSTSRIAKLRLRLALASAVVACLAIPVANAEAVATHYAAPAGTGTAPCLEPTAPCDIETAIEFSNLSNGDTVLLAPGTYTPTESLEVGRKVTISGEPGKATPVIEAGGTNGLFFWETSTIRDIRIVSPAGTSAGLATISNGNTIERVESVGEANVACSITGVVRDTLCVATPILGGGEGIDLFLSGPTPETSEANLFNVTAVGGYSGIDVGANEHSTVILNATNTIASGGTADVIAYSFATTAPARVNLSHSNFATIEGEGVERSVTAPTANGNQSAPPLFVDEASGDFREQVGSPTRLAGDIGGTVSGEVDLAGGSRTTNCEGTVGVDIGAYQFECPTPPMKTIPDTTPPPPAATTATAPKLTKLLLKPPHFAVTGKKKGTTISFSLSESATVKLEVLGKKNGKGKPVVLGALPVVHGKSGANKVKFAGKLKGKTLAPGKYTLRAVATSGGRHSAPQTKPFQVLSPAT
jgi:hypothetical protein